MKIFNKNIECRYLGRQDYLKVLNQQKKLRKKRQNGQMIDTLLWIEHPPVITQGLREVENDFLLEPKKILQEGVQIFKIKRGGRLTYHGPGQWVLYFIFSLKERALKISKMVQQMEEAMILTCNHYGLSAERNPGFPGVWIKGKKIGFIGLSIDRGVSMHGLAFNVHPRLEHFDFIVPCGIHNCQITSLENELDRHISLEEVQPILEKSIFQVFD